MRVRVRSIAVLCSLGCVVACRGGERDIAAPAAAWISAYGHVGSVGEPPLGARARWLLEGLSFELQPSRLLWGDQAGSGVLVVTVLRDAPASTLTLADPSAPGPMDPALDPASIGIELHDGRSVRGLAEEISEAVRQRIRQERVFESRPPAEILRRGRGDCTEIADLSAALLRGAGVAARVAVGVAPHQNALRWHAWVEYWDGRWAPIDPTLGQHPVDAGHIRLGFAATAHQLTDLESAFGVLAISRLAVVPPAAPPGSP